MKIKIVNKNKNPLPKYATEGSVALDLQAFIESNEPIVIKPGERQLIPTGLYVEIPLGYEAQIRPRSGLALKNGLTVLNTPGTIDSDYRGEIGVILYNASASQIVEIENGHRIAQMVINQVEKAEWDEVDDITQLSSTDRGDGGFGHTGK